MEMELSMIYFYLTFHYHDMHAEKYNIMFISNYNCFHNSVILIYNCRRKYFEIWYEFLL